MGVALATRAAVHTGTVVMAADHANDDLGRADASMAAMYLQQETPPGSVMISLMKVRPMSTSPLASSSMAPLPPWAILIFGFIASAMPSFCRVSLKLTPAAAPLAALGYAMAFDPRRSRLTASALEMSGFGAPVLTATPTATKASGVSLAAMT